VSALFRSPVFPSCIPSAEIPSPFFFELFSRWSIPSPYRDFFSSLGSPFFPACCGQLSSLSPPVDRPPLIRFGPQFGIFLPPFFSV